MSIRTEGTEEERAHLALWAVNLGLEHQTLQRGAQDLRDREHDHGVQACTGEQVVRMPRLTPSRSAFTLGDVRP